MVPAMSNESPNASEVAITAKLQHPAIVPVYAPGLPLAMAALQRVFGYCAAFWVVPLCAGAAIWLAFVLGDQVFGRPDIALAPAPLATAAVRGAPLP